MKCLMAIQKTILAGVLFFSWAILLSADSGPGGKPPPLPVKKDRDAQIAALIDQLGSKTFQVREAATRKLMEMDDALPALRRIGKNSDLEVSRRANRIMAVIESRLAERTRITLFWVQFMR